MVLIDRNQDMIFNNKDLEKLYVFKEFPIYMGATEQESSEDKFADMEWMISKNSGLIQLGKLIPEKILYKYSHNSGLGNVWMGHYEAFAQFIFKYSDIKLGVLEIGGGNGLLNSVYNSNYKEVPWTIIEPSDVKPVDGCKALYIRKMWDAQFSHKELVKNYDVLIHSHVMEHLLDLHSFMEKNAQVLKKGQRMLFSLPNLKETLKRKYTNALNFEHTYFIIDEYVEFLLEKYGFKIIARELYREDHSVFYATEKTEIIQYRKNDFRRLYENNKALFYDYIKWHQELIKRLNLAMKNESRPIYLFGAHIFSQYLINFGLNTSKIIGVLDNDILKQEKRLYGTELKISSPKVLKMEHNPVVILKVATYADEIKEDILVNINMNTEFWE